MRLFVVNAVMSGFVLVGCSRASVTESPHARVQIASTSTAHANLINDPEDAMQIDHLGAVVETFEVDRTSIFEDKVISGEANYARRWTSQVEFSQDESGRFIVHGFGDHLQQEILYSGAVTSRINVSLGQSGYLTLELERSEGVDRLRKFWESLYPVTDKIEPAAMSKLRVSAWDFGFADGVDGTIRVSHRARNPDDWNDDQVWMCSDVAANERRPSPENCLSPIYADRWMMRISKHSEAKYFSEINDLVAASEAIRQRRGLTVPDPLKETLKSIPQLQIAASEAAMADARFQGVNYYLGIDECEFGCGNKAEILRAYTTYLAPEHKELVEDAIESGFAKEKLDSIKSMRALTTKRTRDEVYSNLVVAHRLVSQSLEKYKHLLAIEAHHLNSNEVKPGNVSYRSVPLFSPTKPKELEGITPKIDQGRLLLEFAPEAKNLTNEIHNGSIVTLDGFPITVYLLNQKQSDASNLFPLPAVKRPSGSSPLSTPQAPRAKPEAKKAPAGDSKPDSDTCAV